MQLSRTVRDLPFCVAVVLKGAPQISSIGVWVFGERGASGWVVCVRVLFDVCVCCFAVGVIV